MVCRPRFKRRENVFSESRKQIFKDTVCQKISLELCLCKNVFPFLLQPLERALCYTLTRAEQTDIQQKNGLYSSYGSRVCDSAARGGDGIETERDSEGFSFQSDACSTFLFLCSFLDRIHSQRIVSSIEGIIQEFKPGIRIT